MSGRISVTTHGSMQILTLDNPAKRNAVTPAMLLELAEHARRIAADDAVRVVIVRGAGTVFCSGFDVTALPPADAVDDQADDFPGADVLTVAAQALCECPQPVVAAIQGPCFGAGGELAMCADFRLGDTGMSFCMPPARLGLVYSAEGLHRFVRALGVQRTRDLFYTARVVRSQEALTMGLLDRVWEPDAFEGEIETFCQLLADNAPQSLRGTKQILQQYLAPLPWQAVPAAQAQSEVARLRMQAFRSVDHAEGRAAFAAKRKPVFSGS